MTMTATRFAGVRARLRMVAASAALLGLSGCVGFPSLGITEPTDLYVLTPKSIFPDLPRVPVQVVIETPIAAAGVNTDRIAVQPNPLSLQHFPGARWVDRAPIMVQTLLVESFENSGGVNAVGRSAVGLRADYAVLTDLREFQARVLQDDPTGPVEAHVRLNIKIIDASSDSIVGSRSFDVRNRATSTDMIDVVTAFDDALGRAMRDAVVWSTLEMARLGPPRSRRF